LTAAGSAGGAVDAATTTTAAAESAAAESATAESATAATATTTAAAAVLRVEFKHGTEQKNQDATEMFFEMICFHSVSFR
jgi:hypothetical protein